MKRREFLKRVRNGALAAGYLSAFGVPTSASPYVDNGCTRYASMQYRTHLAFASVEPEAYVPDEMADQLTPALESYEFDGAQWTRTDG